MGLFSNIISAFTPKKPKEVLQSVETNQSKQPTSQLFSASVQNRTPANPIAGAQKIQQVASQQNFSAIPKSTPSIQTTQKTVTPSTPSWMQSPLNTLTAKKTTTQTNPLSGIQKVQQIANNTRTMPMAKTQGPGPTPQIDNTKNTQNTQTTQQPSATQNMLDWYKKSMGIQENSANTQIKNATSATDEYIQLIKDSYGRQRQNLIDSIPYLEGVSNAAKEELLAAADDIRKSGALEKEQTEANYDEAALTSAKTKKQTDAQRQAMFAGLGTLDSTGNMGFTGQQINSDEEFIRQQGNRDLEKARALTAIDAKVETAARTAKTEIAKEVAKFQEDVRKINAQVSESDMNKEAQIRAAYTDLKTTVQTINDGLLATQQNGELEKLKYLAEQEKANATANLSPEFIQTGIPKTAADFIYKTQNPAGFETKIGADASKNTGNVLQVVNNVLNGNIGAITGWLKTGWIPGSSGAQTKNDFENLKAMLSLEGRQQLKGSGAISDFEAGILEKAAAMGLGTNLSEDQFRAKLGQLKQELEAGGQNGGVTMNVRQKSTGQTGTIPVGEFDPNLYERI